MKKPLIVVITVLSKTAICRNQYLFSNPRFLTVNPLQKEFNAWTPGCKGAKIFIR